MALIATEAIRHASTRLGGVSSLATKHIVAQLMPLIIIVISSKLDSVLVGTKMARHRAVPLNTIQAILLLEVC